MKVADLFCGCGGFSFGFEAAGFNVIYALDNWDVACKSFSMNFPRTKVVCIDALTLDPSEIPDSDVIIGGPPCKAFSVANVQHKVQDEDLELIRWFLKVIEVKQPKYWIMENVPSVKKFLPSGIIKRTYRMCDYGVPQIRRRVFSGFYNEPVKTPTEVIFPAVMATEFKAGRNSRTRLFRFFKRRALIPECKLVQTFPLDYLLSGGLYDRYIQIGNAVPPLMAYRLADAILNPHIKTLQEVVLG